MPCGFPKKYGGWLRVKAHNVHVLFVQTIDVSNTRQEIPKGGGCLTGGSDFFYIYIPV